MLELACSTLSTRWIVETIRGAEVEVPEVDIGRGYWSWSYESLLQLSDGEIETAMWELKKSALDRLMELLPLTMVAVMVMSSVGFLALDTMGENPLVKVSPVLGSEKR